MKTLELAIVVPTLNEKQNVPVLLERLGSTLRGVEFEVLFVDDDSLDGTSDEIRRIGISNPRVRVLQRVNRRGLASACVEGMMATAAPYIAVMDADLQHDESILPRMLDLLREGNLDLVIGTRNAEGGSMGDFSPWRVRLSNLGRAMSRSISHHELSDPMSGFFMLSASFLKEVVHNISGIGFKILLDIVASSDRKVRIAEVPYRFGERAFGESKLDILVGLEYLQLLLDKSFGRYIPVRFMLFAMVGATGVVLHLFILYALLLMGKAFATAQIIATVVVMTFNFLLNNTLTYRDRRLRGVRIVTGLVTFYAACAVGAFVNVRVATFLVSSGAPWYVGGLLGIVLGSVWNYGVTAVFTWQLERRSTALRRQAMSAVVQAHDLASK